VSSFGQRSFAFRAMPSDSIFMNEICDICIGTLLYYRRFEIIEHNVDSIGHGKRKFDCLSPNNDISVHQYYVESADFDSLKNRFDRILQVSSIASKKYGCDSIIEYKVPDSLTYFNYHFILNEIQDSVQSEWYVIYDESVFDIYAIFGLLEELWDDKDSGSFLNIQRWTEYYERHWRYSLDRL
jgi:hypothetical protein